jgi:hypothetical protein
MHIKQFASDSITDELLFSPGVKRFLFSHCSRKLVKSRFFRKVTFRSPFSQYSRNQPPIFPCYYSSWGRFLEHWRKGGWKVTFLKKPAFHQLFFKNGWKGTFSTQVKTTCSWAVELEADWSCAEDLYEKVVHLPFQSIPRKAKWQLWAEKVTFQLKRYFLSEHIISWTCAVHRLYTVCSEVVFWDVKVSSIFSQSPPPADFTPHPPPPPPRLYFS